jgi:PadR family transcriptional regulator, regulatory protein PadR
MPKDDLLGPLEFQIIAAALHLGPEEAYGMKVRMVIQEQTGRDVLIGTIYSTLERLKTKGYIKTTLGDPTPERGGRAKEFIKVTGLGKAAYNYTYQVHSTIMSLDGAKGSYA